MAQEAGARGCPLRTRRQGSDTRVYGHDTATRGRTACWAAKQGLSESASRSRFPSRRDENAWRALDPAGPGRIGPLSRS